MPVIPFEYLFRDAMSHKADVDSNTMSSTTALELVVAHIDTTIDNTIDKIHLSLYTSRMV